MIGLFKSMFGGVRFIALGLAVGLTIGSCSGFVIKGKFEDSARLRDAERALAATQEAVTRVIEQERQRRAIDDEIMLSVAEQTNQTRAVERVVIKEIPIYVEDYADDRCNFSIGAVRLLNFARSGNSEFALRHPGTAVDEGRATSTLTPRAEVEAHADCAIRYNNLRIRHNSLVELISRINTLEPNPQQ